MTEIPGERARWSSAALIAPLAAVLFSGATAYSLHHDPQPIATAGKAVAAAPKSDAGLIALRHSLIDTARQVATLRVQIASLRAAATGLKARAIAAGSHASAGPSGSVGSSGSVAAVNSGPIVVNIPAPTAPATHATTGGS